MSCAFPSHLAFLYFFKPLVPVQCSHNYSIPAQATRHRFCGIYPSKEGPVPDKFLSLTVLARERERARTLHSHRRSLLSSIESQPEKSPWQPDVLLEAVMQPHNSGKWKKGQGGRVGLESSHALISVCLSVCLSSFPEQEPEKQAALGTQALWRLCWGGKSIRWVHSVFSTSIIQSQS